MTTHAASTPGSRSATNPVLKVLPRLLALAALGGMLLYSKTIGLLAKGAIKAIRAGGRKTKNTEA